MLSAEGSSGTVPTRPEVNQRRSSVQEVDCDVSEIRPGVSLGFLAEVRERAQTPHWLFHVADAVM